MYKCFFTCTHWGSCNVSYILKLHVCPSGVCLCGQCLATARSLCNFLLLSLAAKGKKVPCVTSSSCPCVTSSSCPWQQKEKNTHTHTGQGRGDQKKQPSRQQSLTDRSRWLEWRSHGLPTTRVFECNTIGAQRNHMPNLQLQIFHP